MLRTVTATVQNVIMRLDSAIAIQVGKVLNVNGHVMVLHLEKTAKKIVNVRTVVFVIP